MPPSAAGQGRAIEQSLGKSVSCWREWRCSAVRSRSAILSVKAIRSSLQSCMRMAIASVVLAPFVIFAPDRFRHANRSDISVIAAISSFGVVGFTAKMQFGMRLTTGVIGSAIMSATPAITALGAVIFPGLGHRRARPGPVVSRRAKGARRAGRRCDGHHAAIGAWPVVPASRRGVSLDACRRFRNGLCTAGAHDPRTFARWRRRGSHQGGLISPF